MTKVIWLLSPLNFLLFTKLHTLPIFGKVLSHICSWAQTISSPRKTYTKRLSKTSGFSPDWFFCLKAQTQTLFKSTQDFPGKADWERENTKLKSNQNSLVLWLFYIKYFEFLITGTSTVSYSVNLNNLSWD